MGNIIFDKLSAYRFLKQLDDEGSNVILCVEGIRHSIETTLKVYESNGASNEYLNELRETLWMLQLDYRAFLDDFSAALKNIGEAYEESDKKVVSSVEKSDVSFSGESVVGSINNFVDNNIAKPLTQALNSVNDVVNKSTNSSKSSVNDTFKGIVDRFDKK